MHVRGQEVSWKTMIGIVAAAVVSALPAIRSGSLEGMSEILAAAYLISWGAVVTRLGFHLYEGYAWFGLLRETVLELLAVVVWGVLAVYTCKAEDPQVPMLLACGAFATVLFFLCATELENARTELARRENGVSLRRASDVLRESGLWDEVCLRFHQLDSERARRVGRWFAGADAEDGMLSRAAYITLCLLAAIAIAAGGLALVGTALGMPLTPEHSGKGDGKQAPEPGKQDDDQGKIVPIEPQPPVPKGPSASASGDCNPAYRPDRRVPEPQRTALSLAWHEIDGVPPGPLEALGFDIAGCPGRAQPIPGKPGWWYVPGYCKGLLQAVAIAPAGMEHPIVMLEQAAEFAMPLILDGEFVDAVDRFVVGDGDAYVIDATAGSHVLIREHSTAGTVEGGGPRSGGCDEFVDEDVPYTIVDPLLLRGWRSIAAISMGGVYPIDSTRDTEAVEKVLFRSPAGIVAEGRCWAAQETCGVEIESEWIMGEAGDRTSQEEVEALAGP